MNVSFTSNSLTNSTVVDSGSGQLLYELSTPFGIHTATTMRDAQGREVGAYKPHMIHDEVTYQGKTMRVSEWLTKSSVFSMARTFAATNGRSYKWQYNASGFGNAYQLSDCETGEIVAREHRKATRMFSPSRHCNIDVTAGGVPLLDAIVLSFVICETMRTRREDPATAAATS